MYRQENEILFGPLSFIEVKRVRPVVLPAAGHEVKRVLMVEARVTVNRTALTLEQVDTRRAL